MEIHCAYDQLANVADLKPHPKNPNTHSASQIAAIAAVIEGNGWRAPITVSNRSGFITRGHGPLEAALLLGCDEVPVDFQDYESEQAEVADMLADNHLAELAEIDEDRLVTVLKELQAAATMLPWLDPRAARTTKWSLHWCRARWPHPCQSRRPTHVHPVRMRLSQPGRRD